MAEAMAGATLWRDEIERKVEGRDTRVGPSGKRRTIGPSPSEAASDQAATVRPSIAFGFFGGGW